MSKPDDSHDLPALRERLKAARKRLVAMPISNRAEVGPTDPSTGESWHRGNVLGHMAEMLSYWHDQIGLAAKGSGKVGRDEAGAQSRRRGIDRGDHSSEADLRLSVDTGIENCVTLLDELSPEDLERTVVFHSQAGDRDAQLGGLVQTLVVGHVEDHVTQLEALG